MKLSQYFSILVVILLPVVSTCKENVGNKKGHGMIKIESCETRGKRKGIGKSCKVQKSNSSESLGVLLTYDFFEVEVPGNKRIGFEKKELGGRTSPEGGGPPSWHGQSGPSTFNLVLRNKLAVGSFVVDNMVYQITAREETDTMTVVRKLSSDFPPEADVIIDEEGSQRKMLLPGTQEVHENETDTFHNAFHDRQLRDFYTIDILVAWTPKAECNSAGLDDSCWQTNSTRALMEALIELSVLETNIAYLESGVNAQLRLVHMYPVNYTETGVESALAHLRKEDDGNMDEIHGLREIYGADMVALIVSSELYCGIGSFGPRRDKMFSVTNWDCATGYYTFGHELGHNQVCYVL